MEPLWQHLKRVEFFETDMAGIVHFSNYYKWMEIAEERLLSSMGIKLVGKEGNEFSGWPRVQASCEFKGPLRYGNHVLIDIGIEKVSNHTVYYNFVFHRADYEGNDKGIVAEGKMATVFAKFVDGEMRASLIEDDARAVLEEKVKLTSSAS